MKKQLRCLYFLFLCLLPTLVLAQSRSLSDASDIARAYFSRNGKVATRSDAQPTLVATSGQLLEKNAAFTRSAESDESFYVFNQGSQRFVIVSGDERMKEILGYSEQGAFVVENLPDNVKSWLAMYVKEKEFLAQRTTTYKLLPTAEAQTRAASFPASIAPLLKNIAWDQDAPYNDLCPESGGERTVTGCVATAMAQLMKFHGYPANGIGSNSYTTKTLKLTCAFDFTTSYEWDKMLDTYVKNGYTDEQAEAVATLMYACGVSVNMNYNLSNNGGSGASSYTAMTSLRDYFNYDPNMRFCVRDCYSHAEWMELIKTELSEGRPIYFSASSESGGHAFLFDGYDANDMVHVNWGWGGSSNGYFSVSSLDPDELGIGGGTSTSGFTYDQDMIIGAQKPQADAQEKYISYFLMLDDLAVSVAEESLGNGFTVTAKTLLNSGGVLSAGKLAVLLEKDGQVTELFSGNLTNVGSFRGWSSINLPANIPVDTPEGLYRIRLATKATNETSWQYVRGGAMGVYYLNAEVRSGKVYLTLPDLKPTLEAEMKVVHTLYKNKTGEFVLRVSNTGTREGYVEVNAMAAPKGTDSYERVAGGMVLMLPGESKEITLSAKVTLDAGEYQFVPVFVVNGQQIIFQNNPPALEASVLPTPADSKELTLTSDIELSKQELSPGETLRVRTTLNNKGGLYDGSVYVHILKREAAGSSTYKSYVLSAKKVFIETDTEFIFEHEIQVDEWPADSYMVTILGRSGGAWKMLPREGESSAARTLFTITTTGIEDTAAEETFVLYPSPATDVLHVKSPVDVNRMEIISLNGQLLRQDTERMTAGETRVIPVADMPAGYYILVLRGNDKVYRQKFMKK